MQSELNATSTQNHTSRVRIGNMTITEPLLGVVFDSCSLHLDHVICPLEVLAARTNTPVSFQNANVSVDHRFNKDEAIVAVLQLRRTQVASKEAIRVKPKHKNLLIETQDFHLAQELVAAGVNGPADAELKIDIAHGSERDRFALRSIGSGKKHASGQLSKRTN